MGRVPKRVAKLRKHHSKRRACVYLTSTKYKQYKARMSERGNRGFEHFDVFFFNTQNWRPAALAACVKTSVEKNKEDDFSVVFASAHGDQTGQTSAIEDTTTGPSVAASALLAACLPLFHDGCHFHFHTCWIGCSFERIRDQLNRNVALMAALGSQKKTWQVGAYTQTVPEWKEGEPATFLIDTYVFEGLLHHKAPPGTVRVVKLVWDGSTFTFARDAMLGGLPKNRRG
jgi:hypothetical protein